jgi:ribosomal protein L28
MQATKYRLYPNLQWMKLASGARVKACTKCMKTQSKKLALVAAAATAGR